MWDKQICLAAFVTLACAALFFIAQVERDAGFAQRRAPCTLTKAEEGALLRFCQRAGRALCA